MSGGYRVVAVDATTVCSPGGRDKRYRVLHTAYDVGAQRFVTTEVTDRHVGERFDVGTVAQDEIRLGDRVYARYKDLAAVRDGGAHYVVRFGARSMRLKDEHDTPLSLCQVCAQAQKNGIADMDVRIVDTKGGDPLAARIVILPLAPEKAEAARRQMRKNMRKWGSGPPSAQALATAGCLMLVTSLPRKDWSCQDILALYRQRWQVELAFKRLKSLLDLERLRAFDADLTFAWVNAVLLVALVLEIERPPAYKTGAPDSPPRAAA